MSAVTRINAEGQQEVRTGLGWRKVLSACGSEAISGLPIIDISDMAHPDLERRKAVAKTIHDAAVSSGFFYIRNHSVPPEVTKTIFQESKRFFHDLSLDEKMTYDTEKHDHYYGYYPIVFDSSHPAGASMA
jgi:isopenicillin N synthase-like dioxygenase